MPRQNRRRWLWFVFSLYLWQLSNYSLVYFIVVIRFQFVSLTASNHSPARSKRLWFVFSLYLWQRGNVRFAYAVVVIRFQFVSLTAYLDTMYKSGKLWFVFSLYLWQLLALQDMLLTVVIRFQFVSLTAQSFRGAVIDGLWFVFSLYLWQRLFYSDTHSVSCDSFSVCIFDSCKGGEPHIVRVVIRFQFVSLTAAQPSTIHKAMLWFVFSLYLWQPRPPPYR